MYWCPLYEPPPPNNNFLDETWTITDLWLELEACNRFTANTRRVFDIWGNTMDWDATENTIYCENHNEPVLDIPDPDEFWTRATDELTIHGWFVCRQENPNNPHECLAFAHLDDLTNHLTDEHGEGIFFDPEPDDNDIDIFAVPPPMPRPRPITITTRNVATGEMTQLAFDPITNQWKPVRPPAQTLHGAFTDGR